MTFDSYGLQYCVAHVLHTSFIAQPLRMMYEVQRPGLLQTMHSKDLGSNCEELLAKGLRKVYMMLRVKTAFVYHLYY